MVFRTVNGVRFKIALLTAVLFLSNLAFGQGIVTGSIAGTVTDPTGAVIPGAKVTAKQLETNQSASGVANEAGIFTLRNLPPGPYSITVEAPGFRNLSVPRVDVSVGKDTTLAALKLELGASSEVVEISGEAPIIETNTSQVTATFDAKKITDLPINNNFDSLALFVPGVVSVGDAGFSNTNGVGFSSNGQRGRSNNFQIDGQSNNDNSIGGPSIFFGNQDAISEVQIVTNYTAEYGRNSGSVVNYVTKSGTNQFHGSAFEYYQGSFSDALINNEKSPVFGYCLPNEDPASGCQEPKVARRDRNRFGGTFGGPIVHNKIFFFGSGQGDRTRNGGTPEQSGSLITPTPAGIQALITAFPTAPGTAALTAIGPTTVAAGNPVFSNLVTRSVTYNGVTVPVEFGSVTRFVSALTNDVQATAKVDFQITNKDRFFARYIFQRTQDAPYTGVTEANFAAGAWVNIPAQDQQIGLDWTRTWTTNFVNQTRLSYSRAGFGFEGGSFPDCTQTNITACPTRISFTGLSQILPFGLQTNMPQGRLINNWQVQDNASWQHGRHVFKFGGEYSKQRSPNVFLPTGNGSFTFSSFNNFMAGTTRDFSMADGLSKIPFNENDLAFYLQDDWRVTPNLTLNLGLRWEWFQQAVNLLHDYTVQRESDPATAFWLQTLPVSQRSVPNVNNDFNNISPVFGFAWTPQAASKLFGNGKTVIRGGFRIAYDPTFYNMFLNTATSTPTVNSATLSTTVAGQVVPALPNTGNFLGSDIRSQTLSFLPRGVNPGTRTQTTVAPNFHNPYTEQWSLGVQRELSNKVVAEVRYLGNHSVGLFQSFNANPALKTLIANGYGSVIPTGLTPCTTAGAPGAGSGYADCNFTRVLERGNTASSNYNGLQSELRINAWHGVTANVGYTYSRNIDNTSEVFSTNGGGNTLSFAQNPFDISNGERGVSGISFPNVFTIAFIYDLPFFKSGQGFAGKAFGGWSVNMTHRYQSGQPYTLYQAKGLTHPSLCDPTGTMSTSIDACRPVEWNPSAPFGSAAYLSDGQDINGSGLFIVDAAGNAAPKYTLINIQDPCVGSYDPTKLNGGPGFCPVTPITDAHWVYNDQTAASKLGTPYGGVPRNSRRGQTINNSNLAVFKNTKLTERFALRFEFTAFNVFNRQFLGVPDPEIDDANSFGNTNYNTCGGETENGTCRRRLQFGLKLTF